MKRLDVSYQYWLAVYDGIPVSARADEALTVHS